MRLSMGAPWALAVALVGLLVPVAAAAEQVLKSSSLAACQENSGFTASLFEVTFTPRNQSLFINMIATSSIEGKIIFDIAILAYGLEITREVFDPCEGGQDSDTRGLCPMTSGKMSDPFFLPGLEGVADLIPGIAYTFPDLDAKVIVRINMTDGPNAGNTVACLEATISNGQTVDLIGVKWASAAVAVLAILASAVVSGLGYSNAASHIAANTVSLFSYFQSQAMIGMCGVTLPPAVQSWTQNFQWSMGIINVNWIEKILTWYQRSTGGHPSFLFDSLHTVSVQVQKRGLALVEPGLDMFKRAAAMLPRRAVDHAGTALHSLAKRANIETYYGSYLVYGIQRVAFRAGIESTNLFMTGLTFFYVFIVFVVILVFAWKGICELAAKFGWIKGDTFSDFRRGWMTVLKGILFRVALIGFPQLTVLCMWELTQNDSPAEMVLAVFFFLGILGILSWAAFKVFRLARRSVKLHRNPAYILFSDPLALNKWGFLYVPYRASAYYFTVPLLFYILIKGMFIALAQHHGTVQAVALIIIEAGMLITASVLRPWMDKSTNTFNIAICVMNFLNAIFLFIFTNVLGMPTLGVGIVGVVLWIANAAFSLILLLMLIVTTSIILFHNNPDTRYPAMKDDRMSFMKSNSQLHASNELDALAATARGDSKVFQDDNDSLMSSPANAQPRQTPSPPNSTRASQVPPVVASDSPAGSLINVERDPYLKHRASLSMRSMRAPSPFAAGESSNSVSRNSHHSGQMVGYRSANSPSPWQRGAGYDHEPGK